MFCIKKRTESRRRILGSMLLVITVLFAWSLAPAWADSENRIVKVMTRNMDAGTDLGLVFDALNKPNPTIADLASGASATYKEISQSDIPGRALRIAEEIESQQPYLVSLQEVTLWQTTSTISGVQDLYDQLGLLLDALVGRGLHYEVVASQDLTDITAPLLPQDQPLVAIRFLDRNVVLARSDLKQSELALSNVKTQIFAANFSMTFPDFSFSERNGWISVDAKIQGKELRYVNTHLHSKLSPADPYNVLQGDELIAALSRCKLPVIIAADFNSDASGLGNGPDQTATAGNIISAGYVDAWQVFNAADTGLTWPLFLEDKFAGIPIVPLERIDLIFARDLTILEVQLTGLAKPYGSDHTGVVATLRIDK